MENIRFEELRPDLWSAVEQLFGPNGACDGCWCMCWRTPTYKAWLNIRGAGAKKAFRNLTREGKARGMLAFVGDEPVGCCSFGPRLDFPVLQSIEAYKRDDTGNVWSINRRAEAFGEAATVRIIPLPKSVLKLLCVF